MAGKIFSSRDEISFDEALSDFVFLVHDVLGKQEEPATETNGLLTQLDIGLVELAETSAHLHDTVAAMTMDLLSLTLHNGKLVQEMRLALQIMEALAAPANGEPFEKALRIMKREGEPEVSAVSMNPDDPNEIEVRVQLTFTEESLAEALRVAIAEYNYETVSATV